MPKMRAGFACRKRSDLSTPRDLASTGPLFSPPRRTPGTRWLDKLPSAKEVIDLYPNPVGYGTGMDDCPLFEASCWWPSSSFTT